MYTWSSIAPLRRSWRGDRILLGASAIVRTTTRALHTRSTSAKYDTARASCTGWSSPDSRAPAILAIAATARCLGAVHAECCGGHVRSRERSWLAAHIAGSDGARASNRRTELERPGRWSASDAGTVFIEDGRDWRQDPSRPCGCIGWRSLRQDRQCAIAGG
jgi:hypothetical protein